MRLISLFTAYILFVGFSPSFLNQEGDHLNMKQIWVEETLQSMSIDEKIGQMFMIRAHSDKGPQHIAEVSNLIKTYHVGGLCFFQGTPTKQAELTNKYQAISTLPLMIGIDAEWGLGMRFKEDAISFPRQLMLGAIDDNNMVYEMGAEVGRQLKRIGVHVNFAPVIDVNNNPMNPVINDRSFGEDRYNVATKGFAYMKGMQDQGVIACGKHFPGHGDTGTDSHVDLPVITHPKHRLDSIELMPFKMLSEQGMKAIMVAHIHMPSLDDRPNRPTTLSKKVIEDLLIDEIGFNGLIFTDAMEMSGVTKHYKDGEAELEALLAGNDFIVLPPDLKTSIERIKIAVENNEVPLDRIERSVRKILEEKYDLGLYEQPFIKDLEDIDGYVNSMQAKALQSKLIEQAITVVENKDKLIPIDKVDDIKFASISIGSQGVTAFQKRLDAFGKDMTHLFIPKDLSADQWKRVKMQCSKFDVVFVGLFGMSKYGSKNYGVHPNSVNIIRELAEETKVILSLFGSPYALKFFEGLPNLIVAYDENELTQDIVAQGIFGVFELSGALPVTASPKFPFGKGINTPSLKRLGFSFPERIGMDSEKLRSIDTIVAEMIKQKAAPGCQVLIAKDGRVVFHKSYGSHTYEKKKDSHLNDVYDLASLTKVMASSISIMKLYEQKKLNIYHPLKKYIIESDTSNKGNMIVEDILAHHAGLVGWIPFYAETLDSSLKSPLPDKLYYSEKPSLEFSIQVAKNMYMRSDYPDTMWTKILGSKLRDRRDYRYSDIGFYLMHEAMKRVSGKSIEEIAGETFYKPLGLKSIGFNPLNYIEPDHIVPSENDQYFRNQVIHGFVHDMGAAMLGGVSGHAGLFSNCYDIAVIMQMLLNGGSYGGINYLKPKTIHTFTSRYYRSTRRGIGFDMKELDKRKSLNMSEKASDSTFGHLGFTGTAIFADPDYNIVYAFLSNRTFPSMENNKFGRNEYRARVQSAIYDALIMENSTLQ